jgi:hypothetical protein
MSFKTRSNAVFLDTNAGDLQIQLRNFGAKCVYAVGKDLLRLDVLGARHNALADASAAVAAVTMRSRDPVTQSLIPKADGETVAQLFAQLQSLVDDLISVKSLDKTLNEKVFRMQQQVSRRTRTAFLATPNNQYGDNYKDNNNYDNAHIYENIG